MNENNDTTRGWCKPSIIAIKRPSRGEEAVLAGCKGGFPGGDGPMWVFQSCLWDGCPPCSEHTGS